MEVAHRRRSAAQLATVREVMRSGADTARWEQEIPAARSRCQVGWDVAALRTKARRDRDYHATDESDGLQYTGETMATTHTT